MKRAFIYTGGTVWTEGITESPSEGDLIIAADVGLENARKCNQTPHLLLGDFDSLKEPNLPDTVECIRVPAEKNDTDTQLAVRVALERGCTDITVIGGLDGRLDHTLSAVAILEDLNARKIRAQITNGKNRVSFLRNDSALILKSRFRYLSLIAADPLVKGVTVEGCKYPLKNARLSRRNQYAVSNEITGNCAFIDVRRGGVWLIESSD